MRISQRYPIVEGVTAAALASAYLVFGPTGDFIVAAVLLATLVVVTAIDLQHQLIPDVITLPGILVGLVANLATRHVSWLDSVSLAASRSRSCQPCRVHSDR